mgnify:CR=1 FL=1
MVAGNCNCRWGNLDMFYEKERPDRRCVRRWNVMWPATLKLDGRDYPCTILDLSEFGARIEAHGVQYAPVRVELSSERFGALAGYFRWAQGAYAGLQFEAAAEAVMQVLKPLVPGMGRRDAAVMPLPPAEELSFIERISRWRRSRDAAVMPLPPASEPSFIERISRWRRSRAA